MITRHGGRVTIRRSVDFYVGSLATILLILLTIDALRYPSQDVFRDNVEFLLFMFPMIWFGWLVSAHPKIVILDSGLTVVNWFQAYTIPWAAISRVPRGSTIQIQLHTGEKIRTAVGSYAVVGGGWRRQIGRQLQQTLEEHRQQPGDDNIVTRRLDVRIVPFSSLFILLMILAWLLPSKVPA